MKSLSKQHVKHAGQSKVQRSAANAVRFMSKQLVQSLASQCAKRNVRHGVNVMVTVPSGALSEEFRRLSIPLFDSGAITRPRNTGPNYDPHQNLTFVIHYEMVEVLLRKMGTYAEEEAKRRFAKFGSYLHQLLATSIPEGLTGTVSIEVDDLASTSSMNCNTLVMNGVSVDKLMGYHLERHPLDILRKIVAPYNHKAIPMLITFNTGDKKSVELRFNRVVLNNGATATETVNCPNKMRDLQSLRTN